MRLSDIELTADQVAAFTSWLDIRVEQATRARILAARNAEAGELTNRRYERLCDLARQTARQIGPIDGLGTRYAAEAAWDAFIAGEGWTSPYDIDDHMDIHAEGELFHEGWYLAYAEEIEAMKRERK